MKFSTYVTSLLESSIDYPRDTLCPEIWDLEEDSKKPQIKEEVKEKILETLKKFKGGFDLNDAIQGVRVVGSIDSNRWDDDSDIDVHLTLDKKKIPKTKSDDDWQKTIIKWFADNRDEIDGWIAETHPIEVYWQFNLFQDFASEGAYDLLTDTWLVPPRIVDMDYDPYDDFKRVRENLKDTFEELDLDFGELRRDVIDYETMQEAIGRLSSESKDKLKTKMEEKLEEIDEEVHDLILKKKEIADERKAASQPSNEEEAKKMRDDREWIEKNARFKFLDRYGYLQMISDLQKTYETKDGLAKKDIEKVSDILSKESEE